MVLVRRFFACAPALLLVVLVASPAQAACQTAVEQTLLVPSGIASPPPVLPAQANQGVDVWVVSDVGEGEYLLRAVATKSSFCLPSGSCLVHAVLPDFNVAWYTSDGVQTANHNAVGDEAGTVPHDAAYAVIYMSTGPDWTLFDGPLSDGSAGARFSFRSGCD